MTNKFNTYRNIYTPKVKDYTTVQEWFNLIKKSKYSDIIKLIRNFKGDDKDFYDSQKATLPAITYNFTFKSWKNNSNITGATGLLYIDVDDKDLSFDINTLDKNKIFSYYKSLGNIGYAILVQVEGLTKYNYEDTYASICIDLGLKNHFDKNAKKMTQLNVLSFDPDIFINYSSFVFAATENTNSFPSFDFVPHPEVLEEEGRHISTEVNKYVNNDLPVRYNNLNEIEVDGEYAVNWNGWEYVRCWMPFKFKVQQGNRNSCLLSYCNNLVWLNPQLTRFGVEAILMKVNLKMCEVPVEDSQIKSIVGSIYSQKTAGTLKPIINRKPRKILFATCSELTKEQKFRLCGELMNDKKKNDSLQKLNCVIEDWDFHTNGKITVRAVAVIGKMSKKTVAKYWFEFKEHVAEVNKNMGHVQSQQGALGQLKSTGDIVLPEVPQVLPEALNEVADIAYNFNDAGFNMVGITLLMNAVIGLPDAELVHLVMGIEDRYHDKPVGEVAINAGGVTYSFINDVTASLVRFNGVN